MILHNSLYYSGLFLICVSFTQLVWRMFYYRFTDENKIAMLAILGIFGCLLVVSSMGV